MRGMLVHGGLSRVLVGLCLWIVLGGVVSICLLERFRQEEFVLPVCSLTRMAGMSSLFDLKNEGSARLRFDMPL